MALINQGGKLLLRDGKLASGPDCCCGGDCCTCNSAFAIYANGRILDGFNFGFNVDWLSVRALIPGIGFPSDQANSWNNSGLATNFQCDEDGNLTVRVNIRQRAQVAVVGVGSLEGDVYESRYYKFNLAGGGCGIIAGEPIAIPEGASLVEGAVVDGDVIRSVYELSDGGNTDPSELDSSPLHLDWSGISIHASCQTACSNVIWGDCADAQLYCADVDENCQCEPVEIGTGDTETFPPGGSDPFGNTLFHCVLNPFP